MPSPLRADERESDQHDTADNPTEPGLDPHHLSPRDRVTHPLGVFWTFDVLVPELDDRNLHRRPRQDAGGMGMVLAADAATAIGVNGGDRRRPAPPARRSRQRSTANQPPRRPPSSAPGADTIQSIQRQEFSKKSDYPIMSDRMRRKL